jgi:hypothetical protein
VHVRRPRAKLENLFQRQQIVLLRRRVTAQEQQTNDATDARTAIRRDAFQMAVLFQVVQAAQILDALESSAADDERVAQLGSLTISITNIEIVVMEMAHNLFISCVIIYIIFLGVNFLKIKMNKTPIYKILHNDNTADRLDRLERLLERVLQQQQQRIMPAAATIATPPTMYAPSNVVKSQADCVKCATRAATSEKVLYFALGGVLVLLVTLTIKNMKNNRGQKYGR